MKMASHFTGWTGGVALLLLGSVMLVRAQAPARPRGNPIIFSGPKSDVVSSNLNELRSPASPFREMESTLKAPFEIFGSGSSRESAYPALRRPPPQPEPTKKPLKDILNARAESMFLEPKLHEGETDDDLYKSAAESFDLSPGKPKNALDRYYDRMDLVLTNRAFSPDASGTAKEVRDPLNRNSLSPFAEPRDLEGQRNGADNRFSPFAKPDNTPATARTSIFDDRSIRADLDRSGTSKPDTAFSGYQDQKENRMDAFKRLLEGPSQSRPSALPSSSAYTISPTRPSPYSSPTTVGTGYSPTTATTSKSANSFSKTAGLVGSPGTPQGLPDYTANSTLGTAGSPTQPQPKMPMSSFNLPKRRF